MKSLSGGLPYPYYVNAGRAAGTKTYEHPALRFVNAFSEAQMITAQRMRFGSSWPLQEFWYDTMKEPMKIVHRFGDPIVAEAIKRKREGRSDLEEKDDETLLENLVNSTEDHITLRDEIMSLLVAGRDTVGLHLHGVVFAI